jgi:hypothetical protein
MSEQADRRSRAVQSHFIRAVAFVALFAATSSSAHAQFSSVSDATYVSSSSPDGQYLTLGVYAGTEGGGYEEVGSEWLPSATSGSYNDCSCGSHSSITDAGFYAFGATYLGHLGGTIEAWGVRWNFYAPEIEWPSCEQCLSCDAPTNRSTYWGYYDTCYVEVWIDV